MSRSLTSTRSGETGLIVHDEPLRSNLGKLVIRQAVKVHELLRGEPLNTKRHKNVSTGIFAHLGPAADAGVPFLASKSQYTLATPISSDFGSEHACSISVLTQIRPFRLPCGLANYRHWFMRFTQCRRGIRH